MPYYWQLSTITLPRYDTRLSKKNATLCNTPHWKLIEGDRAYARRYWPRAFGFLQCQ